MSHNKRGRAIQTSNSSRFVLDFFSPSFHPWFLRCLTESSPLTELPSINWNKRDIIYTPNNWLASVGMVQRQKWSGTQQQTQRDTVESEVSHTLDNYRWTRFSNSKLVQNCLYTPLQCAFCCSAVCWRTMGKLMSKSKTKFLLRYGQSSRCRSTENCVEIHKKSIHNTKHKSRAHELRQLSVGIKTIGQYEWSNLTTLQERMKIPHADSTKNDDTFFSSTPQHAAICL